MNRRCFFAVGRGTSYGFVYRGISETGDVDGDGWHDVLFQVRFETDDDSASDDRLVDGRTLDGVAVGATTEPLFWDRAGHAAVDGRGDDLYDVGPPVSACSTAAPSRR